MKYLGGFLLFLLLFSSCTSDDDRRLQTDQSFEGEEMFTISYSLDEHVFYAFRSFDFYRDTTNYESISGCPSVSIEEDEKTVNLLFGEGECASGGPGRRGQLVLSYGDSLLSVPQPFVRISYADYVVNGIQIDGLRLIQPVDSSSNRIVFLDNVNNLIFKDARQSTSKLNGEFTREVVYAGDTIRQITAAGTGWGRNLAGRPFHLDITQVKSLAGDCLQSGGFVPETGEEKWTFERTGTGDVVHSINYSQGEGCNSNAIIHLSDGREIIKTQQ